MTEPTHRLRRYGEDIASSVSPARSRVAAMRAIGRAQQTRLRRTPQIVMASVGAFVLVNVVAAGVADASVPGDTLYPFDRGYEALGDLVGLGGDHSEERLVEAEVLLERSEPDRAIDLILEASELESVEVAAASLRDLDRDDPLLPEHVNMLLAQVHSLVDARHADDPGRRAEAEAAVNLAADRIREQVRSSRGGEGDPPDHAGEQGPPDQAGVPGPPDHAGEPGPPDDAGGPPDQAGTPGPPDGTGNPGPPDGTGNPGPPDGAGNPGPPDETGNPGPPDGAGTPSPPDPAGGPPEDAGPPDDSESQGNQGDPGNQGNQGGPPASTPGNAGEGGGQGGGPPDDPGEPGDGPPPGRGGGGRP